MFASGPELISSMAGFRTGLKWMQTAKPSATRKSDLRFRSQVRREARMRRRMQAKGNARKPQQSPANSRAQQQQPRQQQPQQQQQVRPQSAQSTTVRPATTSTQLSASTKANGNQASLNDGLWGLQFLFGESSMPGEPRPKQQMANTVQAPSKAAPAQPQMPQKQQQAQQSQQAKQMSTPAPQKQQNMSQPQSQSKPSAQSNDEAQLRRELATLKQQLEAKDVQVAKLMRAVIGKR
ncbi:hypothetical protein HDU93_002673 [Gonapodya sp. JEL0774]|nr:hypothetical protein HDU93_002673 [Gonapodya sp. JEL0774]